MLLVAAAEAEAAAEAAAEEAPAAAEKAAKAAEAAASAMDAADGDVADPPAKKRMSSSGRLEGLVDEELPPPRRASFDDGVALSPTERSIRRLSQAALGNQPLDAAAARRLSSQPPPQRGGRGTAHRQ